MSRGGFRGRGRGGGRGAMPSIPGMSHEAYREIMNAPVQHTGKLYPPLDSQSVAFLPRPSEFEGMMIRKETELDEILRKGVPMDTKGKGKGMEEQGQGQGERWCGWRIPEVRKTVGIEIETYSDLFARPDLPKTTEFQLEPDRLKMDERFFPPSLWNAYFAPDKEVKRAKAKAGQPKKKRRILDSDEEDQPDGEGAEKSSNAAASGDEDEDYEDESDHQDYDANYFDNGEGDDDEGGEDEDGGGGGYDD